MTILRKFPSNFKKHLSTILSGTVLLTKRINLRAISTVQTFSHAVKPRNFYDDLELPKTATQSEIRGAYYTLLMLYHPAKNRTDDESAKMKFRRITEAYEVLSNFRTRKMYDKGIGTYSLLTSTPDKEGADDALANFYKRYLVIHTGVDRRRSAREFDKWISKNITNSFERTQHLRQLIRSRKVYRTEAMREAKEMEFFYFYVLMMIIFGSMMFIFEKYSSPASSQDNDRQTIDSEKES